MATVEILLREDVEHVGRRGEVVRVRAGFARNYLLPRKLAMVATSSNVKAIEQERRSLKKREEHERVAAQSLADRLQGVTLEFERKAGEQGMFYGSVTTHDIAHALAERGLEIERRKIHLESPIKQPGHYTATVRLHRDVGIEVPIHAQAEGQEETSPAQAASTPTVSESQAVTEAEAPAIEAAPAADEAGEAAGGEAAGDEPA